MTSKKLSITEKKSHPWLWLALSCMVVAVVLAWLYTRITDPFWNSLLPLPAFAAFAGGILALTRVRSRHYDIELELVDDTLSIRCELRGKAAYKDEWKTENIKQVEIDRPKSWLPSLIPLAREHHVVVTDSRNNERYGLFDVNGRLIPLYKEDAENVISFLHPVLEG